MKKLFLTLFFGFYAIQSQNFVAFKDNTLKKVLLRSNVNTNFDQEISIEEALAVDSLEFDNDSFDYIEDPFAFEESYSDLYAFKNLKVLNIIKDAYNRYKKIDLSNFPRLRKLSTFINSTLTSNFSTLDSLEYLNTQHYDQTLILNSFINLKTLIVEGSNVSTISLPPNLEHIELSSLNIGSLNLSNLKNVKYLKLNNLSNIDSLDISKCMVQESILSISSCLQINSIIFPKSSLKKIELINLSMTDLDLDSAMTENSDIYVDNLSDLKVFKTPNDHQIHRINLKNAHKIKELDLTNSLYVNGKIELKNLTNLNSLILPNTEIAKIELDNLTNLSKLDLTSSILNNCKVSIIYCTSLDILSTDPSKPINELFLNDNRIDILNFNKIIINRLILKETELQTLDLPSPTNLRFLEINNNKNLNILDLELFEKLDTLFIKYSNIKDIFLPQKSNLSNIVIYNAQSSIKNIVNLKNQLKLKTLELLNMQTKSNLDISEMSMLKNFLVYHSDYDNILEKSRIIIIKDTNQIRNITNVQTDKFTYFVTTYTPEQIECKEHISKTMICDDFKDAIVGNETIDEYSIPTDKQAWLYGQPNPYKKAEIGAFWVLPQQSIDFQSSKTRNEDGSLSFKITKSSSVVQPMMLTFGNYTEGNKEEKFTIDLSNNAIISFEIKEFKNLNSNLIVELEDINGNTLSFDKSAPEYNPEENTYYEHYQIGIPIKLNSVEADYKINGIILDRNRSTAESPKFLSGYDPREAVHKFYYDFKNAKCGKFKKILPPVCCSDSMIRLIPTDAKFDFKNVALVKLMRTTNEGDELIDTDYSFTISNFKMGDISQTLSLESETIENTTEEIFKVYDIMGNFVAEGTWEQLMLSHHQLYILKSSERTVKVFVKE